MDSPILVVVLVLFIGVLVAMLVDIYRSYVLVAESHEKIAKIVERISERLEER